MHHQKYFCRHKKKLTVLPFPVVCNWSYYRSPFLQPGPILQIPRALMWIGRCPLLSNSAQTISQFTTLEWSLLQHQCPVYFTAQSEKSSPLWVPVYEFEMVTKSQFHPRWATVMVLSGDCSNLKMQQKLFICYFIALWGSIVLFSNVYISKQYRHDEIRCC